MKITLNEFATIATDGDGNDLPLGGRCSASQELNAVGAAAALNDDTALVRIATDTAVTSNVYGSGSVALHPAGSAEVFYVAGGESITFVEV